MSSPLKPSAQILHIMLIKIDDVYSKNVINIPLKPLLI